MTPTTQAVMATAPTEADALAATAKMGLATKFIMRHQAFFATLLLGLVKKEIPDRYVASDGSVIVCIIYDAIGHVVDEVNVIEVLKG